MKKFDICKKETYNKNGEEKSLWKQVGTMIEFDNGGRMIEIPTISLRASVFEQKSKSQKPVVNDDEIKTPDDLPF